MTSRSSPASLRGAPREAQEGPKRRQGLPKSRPEGHKSRPHAVSERPGRPSGAHLAPKSPRRPPGRHFGPLGVRFCSLRESIFEAAQDPARGLQGASGDPCWDNIKSMLDPSGAHCSFSWSSRASQFWQDLAAKTPQHQAPQGRPRPASGPPGSFGGFLLGQC